MTDAEREAERVAAERSARINRLFYFVAGAEVIDTRRKAALARRDEMLAYQKQAGARRDGDTARFFKAEAQDAMKDYRGTCLVLAYLLNNPPGDCVVRRFRDWPPELIPHAERMAA